MNEEEVGKGLRNSGVPRSEVFVSNLALASYDVN